MSDANIFERFEAESREIEPMTRRERWEAFIKLWVIAPMRIIWRDWRTRIGALIILFYLLMGSVGVAILDAPVQNEGPGFLQPLENDQFLLGTDGMGNDLLAATVHATPAMLKMAIAGGVFTTLIGALVGTIAGYKRGLTERILMTASDVQMAIPGLPLLIVLAVALEPRDPLVVGLLLSVDAWAGLSRQLHSQVLALRGEDYVEASRVVGLDWPIVLRDDIIPNVMPFIMINFMGNTIRVIHASVGLYFLGVLPFTVENWGVMINLAVNNGALLTWNGAHWLIIPIIAINLLGFGVTLFSQGMDRLFNPRVRARHADAGDQASTAMTT